MLLSTNTMTSQIHESADESKWGSERNFLHYFNFSLYLWVTLAHHGVPRFLLRSSVRSLAFQFQLQPASLSAPGKATVLLVPALVFESVKQVSCLDGLCWSLLCRVASLIFNLIMETDEVQMMSVRLKETLNMVQWLMSHVSIRIHF